MSKRLRIFITALITLGLVVMPLRASWAAAVQSSANNTPCHMAMDSGQAMPADMATLSGSDTTPPCCRDHCDGCSGHCGACSPVNVVMPSIPTAQIFPGSPITREVALPVSSAAPQPLLRPPPALYS